jgi:CMP/dCMP kinase
MAAGRFMRDASARAVSDEEEPLMNTEVAQMRVVTISREYGSGGGEIAARLANRLQWQLVDHALVEHVASEIGISLEDAEGHDEQVEGLIERILNNLQYIEPQLLVNEPAEPAFSEADYHAEFAKIVQAAAERGQAVIVGRASQVLLAGQRDVLHVRIVAPLAQRVIYVMQRENLERAAAEARIAQKDRARARYLEQTYHHKSDDAHLYDLVVNTSRLDLECAVSIIAATLHEMGTTLAKPADQLGPSSGLPSYPTPPEDFPTQANP